MARKLRVEYPGAVYHLMSRGDHREPIFRDDRDRQRFLETLAEGCAKTGWQVHAYCLMPNHFHLVVETPQPNLVAGMKWFLGAPPEGGIWKRRWNGGGARSRARSLVTLAFMGDTFFRSRALPPPDEPPKVGGERLCRAHSADAGGASEASISVSVVEGEDAHFVRLASLESGLDGVSPHHLSGSWLRFASRCWRFSLPMSLAGDDVRLTLFWWQEVRVSLPRLLRHDVPSGPCFFVAPRVSAADCNRRGIVYRCSTPAHVSERS